MPIPPTRPTLIQRISDPEDSQAWAEFVEIYTPILFNYCLSRGLQPADATDLTQDVMQSVSGAVGRFEFREGQARFRSWLYGIARNTISNFFRAKNRRPQGDGRTTIMAAAEAQTDDTEEERRWDIDYQRQLFEWAARSVEPEFNPRIWEAFWRTAVLDEDPEEVGSSLGMSRASVYVAKSRCVKRLQEKIHHAGERWEDEMARNDQNLR